MCVSVYVCLSLCILENYQQVPAFAPITLSKGVCVRVRACVRARASERARESREIEIEPDYLRLHAGGRLGSVRVPAYKCTVP